MISGWVLPALLLTAAAPVTDEAWKAFPADDGGFVAEIDTASVTADGTHRSFRMRLNRAGAPETMLLGMTADCESKTSVITRSEVYRDGALVTGGPIPTDKQVPRAMNGDPSAEQILDYVCAR